MSGLVYDENTLISEQLYKYDQFLHSRINKYTGEGRTLVTYFNISDQDTTSSIGMNTNYRVLGPDSPLRYIQIKNMVLNAIAPLTPDDTQASTTTVRNYALNGEAFVFPNTIMPKENDFFIISNINMNHIMRVTQVIQDGLNTDGSYKIMYSLFSTNPDEIDWVYKQTVGSYVMDLQTIGGEDLTPVIGEQDYIYRDRIIKMINDMIENYVARYYDHTHNCFVCRENGEAIFDLCGNLFMAKHGVMMNDQSNNNVVLNKNKIRDPQMEMYYQKSPYKWIERDAPARYVDVFKYRLMPGTAYPDSSFARYGSDIQIMIPSDPWCMAYKAREYFPSEVVRLFQNEHDIRKCKICDCKLCDKRHICPRHYMCQQFDYVSIIRNFIYGRIHSLHDLSEYTGDQLFDNSLAKEIYLWTPIVIYILKQVLKMG